MVKARGDGTQRVAIVTGGGSAPKVARINQLEREHIQAAVRL